MEITHDIGIVYSKNPFIIGFASNENNIQEFEDIKEKYLDLYMKKVKNNNC